MFNNLRGLSIQSHSLSPTHQKVHKNTRTPQPVSPISNHADCHGTTIMNGETATVSIKVCEENGQLFYLGKLKQEPSQVLKIRAWKVDNNKYQAENGTFSYLISPGKIEIWRNGSPIRADSFLTSRGLGK